jgi:hypothetical protein
MLVALGIALGCIVIAAAVHSEIRAAQCGVVLSNGVEVLVSPQMYRAIEDRYAARGEADAWQCWDEAVLEVLRPVRPNEWKFLVRSLGYHVAPEGFAARRQRQTVPR